MTSLQLCTDVNMHMGDITLGRVFVDLRFNFEISSLQYLAVNTERVLTGEI